MFARHGYTVEEIGPAEIYAKGQAPSSPRPPSASLLTSTVTKG